LASSDKVLRSKFWSLSCSNLATSNLATSNLSTSNVTAS
jgi:hypothetical protein